MIENILKDCVEWKNWGWNTITVSFISTLLICAIQCWGLWKQYRTICERMSGASVSVPLFSFFMFSLLAFMFYGFYKHSIAMVSSGFFSTLLYSFVLFGLIRYGSFHIWHWVMFVGYSFMPIAILCVLWKDALMAVIFFVSLIPLAHQPYEIWRHKKAGSVDIRYAILFSFGAFFWTIYGIAIGNWIFFTTNPIALAIMIANIILCKKYKKLQIATRQ